MDPPKKAWELDGVSLSFLFKKRRLHENSIYVVIGSPISLYTSKVNPFDLSFRQLKNNIGGDLPV